MTDILFVLIYAAFQLAFTVVMLRLLASPPKNKPRRFSCKGWYRDEKTGKMIFIDQKWIGSK